MNAPTYLITILGRQEQQCGMRDGFERAEGLSDSSVTFSGERGNFLGIRVRWFLEIHWRTSPRDVSRAIDPRGPLARRAYRLAVNGGTERKQARGRAREQVRAESRASVPSSSYPASRRRRSARAARLHARIGKTNSRSSIMTRGRTRTCRWKTFFPRPPTPVRPKRRREETRGEVPPRRREGKEEKK